MNKCSTNKIKPFEIIKECSTKMLKSPEYSGKLYDVTETFVFKIKASIRGRLKDLVVKISKFAYDSEYEYDHYKHLLKEEAEHCINMSDIKIGPKVYEVFYVNNTYGHSKGNIHQYIVMDSMSTNAKKALNSNLSISDKIYIIDKMFDLLHRQIESRMYCYDIKPGNYTVNVKNNKVTDVKMIDFGYFCKTKLNELKYDNITPNDLLISMYIQLMIFIFDNHSNVYKQYKLTKGYKKIMTKIYDNIDSVLLFTNQKGKIKQQLMHYFNKEIYQDFLKEIDIFGSTK